MNKFSVLMGFLMVFSTASAMADDFYVGAFQEVALPSCGGTVEVHGGIYDKGNPQDVHVSFKNVQQCGTIDLNIKGKTYSMDGSQGTWHKELTIPSSWLTKTKTGVQLVVHSQSAKHSDTVRFKIKLEKDQSIPKQVVFGNVDKQLGDSSISAANAKAAFPAQTSDARE